VTKGAPVPELFHAIEPLKDPRWEEFVQRHPRSSIFHTTAWLSALQHSYGYEPVAFTSSPEGAPLRNGVVFSRVSSWLVRPRLVGLPFSDHAEPLLNSDSELADLFTFLERGLAERKWHKIELRPLQPGSPFVDWAKFRNGRKYLLHTVDLQPSLEQLFRALHKDSIQRKIRRAEREGLSYEEGRSESFLRTFYALTVLTRRRQSLPPPPLLWFKNVLGCLGDRALIRIARKNEKPIAAIFTLRHKDTVVYKYGCSDARFHNLGGVPFLLWKTIEDAKRVGATTVDFGRSDPDNDGLITFKERFGARSSFLVYKTYPQGRVGLPSELWQERAAKRVFALLPQKVLVLVGGLVYPHIG
jgi:hypothetical protein